MAVTVCSAAIALSTPSGSAAAMASMVAGRRSKSLSGQPHARSHFTA